MQIRTAILLGSIICWSWGFSYAQSSQSIPEISQESNFKNALHEISDLKSSFEDFKKKLFDMDAAVKTQHEGKLDQQYKEVRLEMVKVIQTIDFSTQKLIDKINNLYAAKKKIKKTLKILNETREHLALGKKYLQQLLLLLYKVEKEIYNETGEEIDPLKLFIKSESLPHLLVGEDTLKKLLAQVNDLLQTTSQQEKKKIHLIQELTRVKNQAEKDLEFYHTEIEKLKQKKSYLANFMQLYNTNKKLGIKTLSGIQLQEKNLQGVIKHLVQDIINKQYRDVKDIPAKIKALQKTAKSAPEETSPVARPIYPIRQILTIFKDPSFEKEHQFQNTFLKIAVEQGSPVYAMKDGVVYYTEENPNSISWMMIVHPEGYISTYMYLNKLYVEPGTIVKRGQVIGRSGGEPGTHGAGFNSKEQNLTFSLFKDGVAIDPLIVLDLSVVEDKNKVLPEEYRIKYFNDHYVRPIDVSNLALLKGNSVDERSQTFLNTYAVGIYRNLDFREQVVKGTNIDRDMVICVGFAESTLGKFLATDNNIGNVGNNDRGDRIAYDNPYAGARLIPLTLNNQFLGNYHTIKQLSRYGNPDGKIYASSPINWQTNVLKCLSKIKGYYIPEDFPFRTGPNPGPQPLLLGNEEKNEKSELLKNAKMIKKGGEPQTQSGQLISQ